MIDFITLLLAGLVGGFMAGLLGIGGGLFYILVLPLALTSIGVHPDEIVQYTLANSIFGTTFAALSGSLTQMRHRTFYLQPVLWVSLGAITLSLTLLYTFVNTPLYNKATFNTVVVILLLFILWRTLIKSRKKQEETLPERPAGPLWFLGAGTTGGLVAALSGLGGGAIVVPFLSLILRMDIKKAKSISLGMIFFSSLTMTLFNMAEQPLHDVQHHNLGYIVFPIVLPLGIGVVTASPFGVKAGRRMSSRIIAFLFSLFLAIVIIKKTYELYLLTIALEVGS